MLRLKQWENANVFTTAKLPCGCWGTVHRDRTCPVFKLYSLSSVKHQTMSRNIFSARAFLIDTTLFSKLNIDFFCVCLCKTQFQTSIHAFVQFFFFIVRVGASVVSAVFHSCPLKLEPKTIVSWGRRSAVAAATLQLPVLSSLSSLKPTALTCFLGEDVDSLCACCQMAEPSHSI